MLHGVDVSGFQSVDFDFSPYDFGIIKATEGNGPLNSNFQGQVDGCLRAGKLLGFYHYAHPELNSNPETEARAFLDRIKPYIGKCVMALDWEGDATSQPVSWALNWLKYVHNETGVRPFFYSYSNYIMTTDLSTIAASYPLWLAQYTSGNPSWKWWDKWTMWQYTDSPVDQNRFDGTVQDWNDWSGEVEAEWISFNGWFTQGQKENNAQLFMKFFRAHGWTLESICAMLGNIDHESQINPGIWGNLSPWGNPSGKGYGLVQWTPYTRITDWMVAHGYEIGDGQGQCEKIQEELDHPEIENTWHTAGTPYTMTFKEFSRSNASPDQLAMIFLACYERPLNPNQPERGVSAMNWYSFLRGAPIFKPRLNTDGMLNSEFWYSTNNPYYPTYKLPNCTCYVWGRWWEITGTRPTNLSIGDGGDYWDDGIAAGIPHGSTPQLGAIACWKYDPWGHVAVVEQINTDGSIVISQSGYPSDYFWTETLYPPYVPSWIAQKPSYKMQGFLYLNTQPTPPDPVLPPSEIEQPANIMYYLKII